MYFLLICLLVLSATLTLFKKEDLAIRSSQPEHWAGHSGVQRGRRDDWMAGQCGGGGFGVQTGEVQPLYTHLKTGQKEIPDVGYVIGVSVSENI